LLRKGESYAWARPSLHARKLRDLELKAGYKAERDTESALVREYRAHRVEKERRAALWASVFPEPHQTADSDEEGDGDGDAAARLFVTRARDDGWGEARHPLPERMDVLPSLPPALPIAPPPRPAPGKATIESGRPANNLRDPSFEDDSDIPF
jgi:hypothetical protein